MTPQRGVMAVDTRTEVVLGHIQDATPEICTMARQTILAHDPNASDIVDMLGLGEVQS